MNNNLQSPLHVAIIMDGNRRWAKKHFLKAVDGHKKGAEQIKQICKNCIELGIKKLTLYAFSTENWLRSKEEVDYLTKLMKNYLDGSDIQDLILNGVSLKIIGDPAGFGDDLHNKIKIVESNSAKIQNKRLHLNIALNYGARQEVVFAINKAMLKGKTLITEDDITNNLQETQNVDLMIRTGGDFRFSNFLLWQNCYAELFFTQALWPDFNKQNLIEALDFFKKQKRNFGC